MRGCEDHAPSTRPVDYDEVHIRSAQRIALRMVHNHMFVCLFTAGNRILYYYKHNNICLIIIRILLTMATTKNNVNGVLIICTVMPITGGSVGSIGGYSYNKYVDLISESS